MSLFSRTAGCLTRADRIEAMTDLEVGPRIGRWRRRRGLSQVALAGLVGRSESWLSQVERGVRGVDSVAVLRDLARVLRVDVEDLAPSSASGSSQAGRSATVEIERALFAPRRAGSVSFAEVTAVHAAYQAARYGEVLDGLPELMDRLAAVRDSHVSAAGWAVVARTLTKVGADDLALVAAERARDAAWCSGDRADVGMAVYQVVCALLPTGRASVAEELAIRTAGALHDSDDAVRSVSGALWLIAAVAAARRGDAGAAAERLDLAQRQADAVGRDANLRWSAFGPTNVALHRVSVAAELGDAPAALAAAATLDLAGFAPVLRSRRAQVGLDLAWAHACRRQDAQAVLALLDVERAAPTILRHNVYARATISTLLGRARGSAGGHIRALAARSDLAS